MTRWKWDADQSDPLNEHRIPVTSDNPLYTYIACFHKDSPHRPTDLEIQQLRAFIDHHMDYWFTTLQREAVRNQPFDTELGRHTVIFHKYGTGDWGYRRKSWPLGRFTPPSPRVATRALGPMSLVEVMDLIHNVNAGQEGSWHQWKADHPEVFGE